MSCSVQPRHVGLAPRATRLPGPSAFNELDVNRMLNACSKMELLLVSVLSSVSLSAGSQIVSAGVFGGYLRRAGPQKKMTDLPEIS